MAVEARNQVSEYAQCYVRRDNVYILFLTSTAAIVDVLTKDTDIKNS